MYIHTRCLEEHLRYYPDGLCTVCRQPMKYTNPKEYIAFAFMFLCLFSLLVMSNMDFLAKLFTFMVSTSILVALLLRHCILQEFGLVVITCVVAFLGATTRDQRLFMTFSIIMIMFATFATLIHYIPQTYVMMFLAVLFLGMYVLVFMAAVSAAADIYGSSVILTTILLVWYTWIRLHPPLRQIQE